MKPRVSSTREFVKYKFSAMPLSRRRTLQIRGEKVTIRTTTREDLANVMALWNDGRVMRWVGFPNGLDYDEERTSKWFEKLQSNPNCHHFVVYADAVGFCGEVYYAVDTHTDARGLM